MQIVKLLLKSGAKTNAVNIRGKTPLDVCRSPGILLLLEKADSGDLDFDSPEKDLHRVKLHGMYLILNGNCDCFGFWFSVLNNLGNYTICVEDGIRN